jgi:hypothetical protein
MKDDGKFYCHSVYFNSISYTYFMAIWYILWSFWYILTILVCCTEKNLATRCKIIALVPQQLALFSCLAVTVSRVARSWNQKSQFG